MTKQIENRKELKQRRERKTRAKLNKGSAQRPRLSVYRSNKFMYAQIIDDQKGETIASAHSKEGISAEELGKKIASASKKAGVTDVVFDRGSFAYAGKVKALAEAARSEGLNF